MLRPSHKYISFFPAFLTTVWMVATLFFAPKLHAQQDTGKPKVINIINADVLKGSKVKGRSIQRLIGRVVLEHEGAQMFCDSALFYDSENYVEAFGRIHIQQGDTLNLYGDSLNYNGQTKIATINGRVRLIDPQVNLTTSKLIYDRNAGTAYYNQDGKTITQKDQLTSQKGYYYVNSKEFAFKGDVVIQNPEYTLYSDTLIYNTVTDVSYFKGPSTIVSKESYIYCENGWYDKINDRAQFNQNAYVIAENNIMKGDSLYYERKNGYGKGIGHVSIEDTVEHITVLGNFAETHKNIERYMVTDSAQMIQAFEDDTLFLHADTLLATQDTTDHRIIDAFYKVKFFKKDMQGACDSLSYTQRDSLLRMYRKPIIWNDSSQITAEYIQIMISKGKVYRMDIEDMALLISEVDTIRFNQIGGNRMVAWFGEDNEIRKIDVFENGKTIYYPTEDDGNLIGMNKVDCTDICIYIENRKIQRIVFKQQPVGELIPDEQINPLEYRLEGFEWLIDKRPKNRWDIFTWN